LVMVGLPGSGLESGLNKLQAFTTIELKYPFSKKQVD